MYNAWLERFSTQQKDTLADRQGLWALSEEAPKQAFQKYYRRHKDLKKAESSALTQARTGKIGFRAFLFKRRVPGVATPLCECGEAPETVSYLLEGCSTYQDAL